MCVAKRSCRGLEKHGGRLLTSAHVERVVEERGRAAGVALRGGGVVRARKAVVSSEWLPRGCLYVCAQRYALRLSGHRRDTSLASVSVHASGGGVGWGWVGVGRDYWLLERVRRVRGSACMQGLAQAIMWGFLLYGRRERVGYRATAAARPGSGAVPPYGTGHSRLPLIHAPARRF